MVPRTLVWDTVRSDCLRSKGNISQGVPDLGVSSDPVKGPPLGGSGTRKC